MAAVDQRHFLNTRWECDAAVEYLNQFLEYDGYTIHRHGLSWEIVTSVSDDTVEVHTPFEGSTKLSHEFISQQLDKSKHRLGKGDYDGAITSARSLLQAVLSEIERTYNPQPLAYDGNLPKPYRRVQQHLNLTPGQDGLADCLRQILSGMTSVVNGLAALRNKMSDAHVVTYRAEERHARLAVNSARTMVQFLFDTSEYQKDREPLHAEHAAESQRP